MQEQPKTTTETKKTEDKSSKTPATGSPTDVMGSPTVKEISMNSGNLFFKPNTLSLKMNQPVKITFKNAGVHTFTVDKLGVNLSLTGGSGSITFTPQQAGTFQYYCAIPGHKEGGMIGTLTVTQ